MTTSASMIPVRLRFTPRNAAVPDLEHPGLLRAGSRTAGPYGRGAIEHHRCPATDLCRGDAPALDLLEPGLDTVDLSPCTTSSRCWPTSPRPDTSPTTRPGSVLR
jgi:hypothetical protein